MDFATSFPLPAGHLIYQFPSFIPVVMLCCSVGIATDYGMDGPGSNPGGDEIFRQSGPSLEHAKSPLKWVPGCNYGCSRITIRVSYFYRFYNKLQPSKRSVFSVSVFVSYSHILLA